VKKIAMVVHRYGREIGSGAELLTMQYAEKLKDFYDVNVLTTTCLDYNTWENHYPQGETIINGVTVLRFPTLQNRQTSDFNRLCETQLKKIRSNEPTELKYDHLWMKAQGPYCPDLMDYIETHQSEYDVFIFITYIYYTSAIGLPMVAGKSIFIPTAHDEPWIRQSIFQSVFNSPRYFCYLTEEEAAFVKELFKNEYIQSDVVGTGISIPDDINPERGRQKFGIDGNYVTYVGRVDESKRCNEMISHFIAYKEEHPSTLKLVLIGTVTMKIPSRPDIISLGFVDEQDKFDIVAGADLLLAPSEYESLCISLLEGFSLGVAAMVNGRCAVLRGHCEKSEAGFCYTNQREFTETMYLILNHPNKENLRQNAINYVESQYTWEQVTKKLCAAIDFVADPRLRLLELGIEKSEIHSEYIGRDIFSDTELKATVLYWGTEIYPAFAEEGVSILCVSSNAYACFLGVLISSIISNASPDRKYDIIILKDDMSKRNMNLITALSRQAKNISIRFMDVGGLSDTVGINRKYNNYNQYTYYRLYFLSLMKNYEKVLYLDSDTLVNADVASLYDTNLNGYDLAATYDVIVTSWRTYQNEMTEYFLKLGFKESERYFQAGVILFNVKEMRERYKQDDIIKQANENQYLLHDQDLLNVLCKSKVKFIGQEWNVFNIKREVADLENCFLPSKLYDECAAAMSNPKIIHYTENQFPCYVPDSELGYLYWQYARETPFYENLIHIMIGCSATKSPDTVTTTTATSGIARRIYRKICRIFHK
jgi:lipopolysaccharide biosynthesis glycosyltransferase/glycosyltransferase involved in cell wall biosynthesis